MATRGRLPGEVFTDTVGMFAFAAGATVVVAVDGDVGVVVVFAFLSLEDLSFESAWATDPRQRVAARHAPMATPRDGTAKERGSELRRDMGQGVF